jgi:hypothetical protein
VERRIDDMRYDSAAMTVNNNLLTPHYSTHFLPTILALDLRPRSMKDLLRDHLEAILSKSMDSSTEVLILLLTPPHPLLGLLQRNGHPRDTSLDHDTVDNDSLTVGIKDGAVVAVGTAVVVVSLRVR